MEYLNEHWEDHHLHRLQYDMGGLPFPNLRVFLALFVMLLFFIGGEWTRINLPERYDKYTDAWMWRAQDTVSSIAEEYPSGHVRSRLSTQDRSLTVGFYEEARETTLDSLRMFGARHDVDTRVITNMGVTYRDHRRAAEAVYWYLYWEKEGKPFRYFVGKSGLLTVTIRINLSSQMDEVTEEIQRLIHYKYGSDTRLNVKVEHDPDLTESGATWRRY